MGIRSVITVVREIASTVLLSVVLSSCYINVMVIAGSTRPYTKTVRLTLMVSVVGLRLVT